MDYILMYGWYKINPILQFVVPVSLCIAASKIRLSEVLILKFFEEMLLNNH